MPRLHLGIDFDNTLVCYDGVFHAVALEQGLIPPTVARTKEAVRDFLRSAGREAAWTELQGTVYGSRMREAEAFPGALACLAAALKQGTTLSIISHKTRVPYRGHPWDLQGAAWDWLDFVGAFDPGRIGLSRDQVHFLESKEAKLARIGEAGCTHFLDDLPEILLAPGFPAGTRGLLFGEAPTPEGAPPLRRLRTWRDVAAAFGPRWEGLP